MDKISVIMGVYNPRDIEMLKKSIESILTQSYENFEFIICDDFSNLEIQKILLEYKEKDKRIMVIRNTKNMGLAASLNNCLGKATGKYIARQDDDDISKKADFKLSFSKMTFTHQMIRVILLEQIYRAFKILNNENYHR